MPTLFHEKVVVNGITFNEPITMPAYADDWCMDLLDGWDDTADIDVRSNPRGGDVDGEIVANFFPAKARFLTASGSFTADSRAEAQALGDIIIRDAFPRNTDIELIRHEPVVKTITCRVAGKREIKFVGPKGARWSVPLIAEDPIKYSYTDFGDLGYISGISGGGRRYPRTYPLSYQTTTQGSANGVIAVNEGTAYVYPKTLTLYGPLTKGGWRVSNDTTGLYIKFDVGLGSTDQLDIDFYNEVAYLNGYPVTSTISGDFWKLAPGSNEIKLYADYNAQAYFNFRYRYGWEN